MGITISMTDQAAKELIGLLDDIDEQEPNNLEYISQLNFERPSEMWLVKQELQVALSRVIPKTIGEICGCDEICKPIRRIDEG